MNEFHNLFPKNIPTELPPLREMNHCINPAPGSEWLPTWRTSAHKFGQQIDNNLNAQVETEHMYPALNDLNVVVMFCVGK